ncbi:MAG: glycosyltransferase family 2 protein, partial [Sulfitobacter sp.]|nr:glycosyltransferase family 2 protein [Sulfitobacter sp.]
LITACGGNVRFDNAAPQILYRQHADNLIGSGRAWRDQLRRKTGVIKGVFSERIDGNIAALQAVSDMITPDARDILNRFAKAREANGIARLLRLYAVGPYRQKRRDTLGFWGAASLGKS